MIGARARGLLFSPSHDRSNASHHAHAIKKRTPELTRNAALSGDDLEKAERVTLEAVRSVPDRVTEHEVELFYQGFGDSSIDLEVRFWIKATSNGHFQEMRSRAVKAIKAAYDREGITIPFPQTTLSAREPMRIAQVDSTPAS